MNNFVINPDTAILFMAYKQEKRSNKQSTEQSCYSQNNTWHIFLPHLFVPGGVC